MKKILLAVTAALAITSCSQNEDEVIINNDNPVEINLNGGVEATTVSRAAINKGDALSGIQFVRVDGNDIGTLEDFSNVTIIGAMAAGGTITFSPVQYYPSNGSTNANILGFYPAATSIAAGVATMTITGDEDVLYASAVSGSKETPIATPLSFQHKLTQFKFVVKRDATSTDADIANVAVTIKDANSIFKMSLVDGALSDWGTPIPTINAITNATATTAGTSETVGFMLEPNLTSLVLTVSATGYDPSDVTITGTDGGKFEMGKAYTITLTFKGKSITPSGAIAEWTTGTGGAADIE